MKQLSTFASFFLFPTGVLFAHLIASRVLHLYNAFPHMDIPAHYIGGLSISYTAAHVLSHLEKQRFSPPLGKALLLVLLISLTASAAVFWEFAEFIIDRLMDTNIQISLGNTMQDQFIGILGGVTWAFIYYRKLERIAETHVPG